ncbi:hypothetical protein EYF80_036053 [Liparis tanakae]|uniref:Uncharacterized protein n=1 Tax=Liparis tanakae TaxID=230148 RepID=A0A4Z2GLP6_9TELE|nr:hypothetical protein EYF80_036053 [Liparis tanakae]
MELMPPIPTPACAIGPPGLCDTPTGMAGWWLTPTGFTRRTPQQQQQQTNKTNAPRTPPVPLRCVLAVSPGLALTCAARCPCDRDSAVRAR